MKKENTSRSICCDCIHSHLVVDLPVTVPYDDAIKLGFPKWLLSNEAKEVFKALEETGYEMKEFAYCDYFEALTSLLNPEYDCETFIYDKDHRLC